jgi:hypothetical protein
MDYIEIEKTRIKKAGSLPDLPIDYRIYFDISCKRDSLGKESSGTEF